MLSAAWTRPKLPDDAPGSVRKDCREPLLPRPHPHHPTTRMVAPMRSTTYFRDLCSPARVRAPRTPAQVSQFARDVQLSKRHAYIPARKAPTIAAMSRA